MDLEKTKDFAVDTALLAGKSIMKNFNNIKSIKTKLSGRKRLSSLVTNADIEADKIIISRIRKRFPKHNIISEESGTKDNKSDYTWHIDPLDGTHNYIYGNNLFGTSIALAKDNKPLLGVVYFPLMDELYYSIKGKGSYSIINKRKTRLKPGNKQTLKGCLMLFGSVFYLKDKRVMRIFKKLSEQAFRIRIYGCATIELVHIASGKADFYINFDTKSWDIAAAGLIAEQAGAKVTYFNGKEFDLKIKDFVAGNKYIHKKILKLLR